MKNYKNNKKIESLMTKCTSTFLILLITLYLFYTGANGYLNIQNSKYLLFVILCGGYIIISAICIMEGWILYELKPPPIKAFLNKSSFLQKCVVAYMLLTWLSALFSSHFPETVIGASRNEGALSITLYCLTFLLVSRYGKTDKYITWAFFASALLFGALCSAQLWNLNPFHLYPDNYTYSDAYVAYAGAYLGTVGNVDLVAAYMCLVIPVIGVTLIKLQNRKKYFLFVPLTILLYVLVKMNVLAGIIGVMFGAVLIVGTVAFKTQTSKRIYALCILIMSLAGIIFIYLADMPFELLHQLHEALHGRVSETFGSGRIYIWKNVIMDLKNHFWFGSGPDTMVYAGIEPFTRYNTVSQSMIVSGIDVAHNEYLNILSQQGFFALISYIAIPIFVIYKWVKVSFENAVAAILGSGLVCYFIQAFFGFSMCMTAPYFWVMLALFDKSLKGEEVICGKK